MEHVYRFAHLRQLAKSKRKRGNNMIKLNIDGTDVEVEERNDHIRGSKKSKY